MTRRQNVAAAAASLALGAGAIAVAAPALGGQHEGTGDMPRTMAGMHGMQSHEAMRAEMHEACHRTMEAHLREEERGGRAP